tara:strand:+ start:228 stop:380 length:153 start_codon:yes stop_codon:yes gene_type:complete
MQDFKLGAINLLTFSVSFSGVEQWLKITLLAVSIIYTTLKIVEMKNKRNE